MNKCIIKLS